MKKRTQKKGFTIVETLVAVAILVIGITAPITVITSAINASRVAEQRTFAYYLAQEGVEYIRYVRDTNIINNRNWLANLSRCDITTANPCDIITPIRVVDADNDLRNCGGGCNIYLRNADGLYGSNAGGGTDSGFDRIIEIDEGTVVGTDEKEALITVTVTWASKGQNYTYVLEERIYNWSGG